MKQVNGMILFWGNRDPWSNWYKSPFVHEGVNYNLSEQFMMREKALRFGDVETAQKVMETLNPKEQKMLGRQVKNFNAEVWLSEAVDIMVPALVSKFTSTPDLLETMVCSGSDLLVEVSPVDQIWGIGLAEDDPRAWDQATWQGKNLLGVALMKARREIFKQLETLWDGI